MDRERLGPYLIGRELGAGGMGAVHAATLERETSGLAPGTRVALKIVHPHLLATEGFFKRFLREAEIGQSVAHENVVRTIDCDALDGHHFLVMEYVEGQDLRALLEELGAVPEQLCRHVAREIATGLSAIHAAGVVHRDLKPENVMITPDHVVKVMDLGVARLADEQLRLSQTGAFVGSVEYAAPEQFGGREIDHRCDLHALGVLLYELASGRHPFRGDDFRSVMRRVCGDTPRRLGDLQPELSPFLEEFIHTLLAKRPDDRFESAAHVVEVLGEAESSSWWREHLLARSQATCPSLRRVRIPRETGVYGRDAELGLLAGLLARASGGDGQVVLIEGEAGIGKSRLVDELVVRAGDGPAAVQFLHGGYPPGGAATAGGAFKSALREHLDDRGVEPHLRSTPLLVPAFDAFLRGDAVPTGAEPLTKDSLQSCFVNLVRSIARDEVVILLIDDIHFAPDEGRALFSALAMAVPGHKVLLIATTRPEHAQTWTTDVSRLEHCIRLTLDRLGPKDLAQLLEETFKSRELATRLGHQIAVKSDGNPFFVFEIVRGLREGSLISETADGVWESSGDIAEIQIPSSVLDLVAARLAKLDDDERALLDVAACAGFEFDPAVVATVLGMERMAALRSFARIERRHRLIRASERLLAFDHHQVHEALRRSLHVQLREGYHSALARVLEDRSKSATLPLDELDGATAVELCDHYLRGGDPAAARRYLGSAQLYLSRTHQQALLIELSERALEQDTALVGVARGGVLRELSDVLHATGRREREEEVARELLRIAEEEGDDQLERHAVIALGNVLFSTARYDEAQRVYERRLALARKSDDAQGEAAALGGVGLVLQHRGQVDEARERFEDALRISREAGEVPTEAAALLWLGNTYSVQARVEDARAYFEQALAKYRELGSRSGEAMVTANLGIGFATLGDNDRAREHGERAIEICREFGHRLSEAIALFNLGSVLRDVGDLQAAERALLASGQLCAEVGHGHLGAAVQRDLGSLRIAMGALDDGRDALRTAAGAGFPAEATMALCELATLTGEDVDAALAALEEHAGRLGARDLREARWLLWVTTRDVRHLEEANRLLDQALSYVSPQHHAAMCANRRVDRAIRTAWAALHGDGEPDATESVTRSG